MFHRDGHELLKKKQFSWKKSPSKQYGQIQQGKEDVDKHQGVDTLDVFVRNSSRASV